MVKALIVVVAVVGAALVLRAINQPRESKTNYESFSGTKIGPKVGDPNARPAKIVKPVDPRLLTDRGASLRSKFGDDAALKILADEIWFGMTDSMFAEVAKRPDEINRTISATGKHEQWVYRTPVIRKRVYSTGYRVTTNDRYFYFDDGILTSMQESDNSGDVH